MGEKDIAEKVLLDYHDIFADIVNVLLFGGENKVEPAALEDMTMRSAYKADGKVRNVERDVAKRWKKGGIRIACFGAENQTGADPLMPLRVFGYDGDEYKSQCIKANRGKPNYPVVTLVLYYGYKERWNAPLTLHEALKIDDDLKPFVPDLKINLFEIAYLPDEQVRMFKSDFREVADYFSQKRKNGDYKPSKRKIQHIKELLQLLTVMEGDNRFEGVFEDVDEGKVENMCDVLDRVEEKRAIDIAKRMIEDGELPLKKIADYTGLPLEKVQELAGPKTA